MVANYQVSSMQLKTYKASKKNNDTILMKLELKDMKKRIIQFHHLVDIKG